MHKAATTAPRTRDAVQAAISAATRAALKAQGVAYGDTRVSGGLVTDHIDAALAALGSAAAVMGEVIAAERADAARAAAKDRPDPKPEAELCHVCEEQIARDDVAICNDCARPACPGCMGDDGACVECEAGAE